MEPTEKNRPQRQQFHPKSVLQGSSISISLTNGTLASYNRRRRRRFKYHSELVSITQSWRHDPSTPTRNDSQGFPKRKSLATKGPFSMVWLLVIQARTIKMTMASVTFVKKLKVTPDTNSSSKRFRRCAAGCEKKRHDSLLCYFRSTYCSIQYPPPFWSYRLDTGIRDGHPDWMLYS